MVLGPAPPFQDGTQRRKDKEGNKKGRGGERGEHGEMSRMRMSESSLTLEALMSDLVRQLEGHFLVLTDGRNPPPPHTHPQHTHSGFASILLPPALSLYLPDYYCSAAFDPPPAHQSMQTAEK